ncbi:hypothetical protein [Pseudidiomarina insulisalsae]|uniref:MSHA biogenesis protein MshI n=1 Tax=Pseudidiomarina insulisalsae TaxID=575789 RepID=A0A432YN45_9GAMM|nr:hypothetical protein [Pseudidiomarina insulisalsae]RUO62419.1 hypothetical protein CWI71_02985 [Pseudidiomarina insulisalsae]
MKNYANLYVDELRPNREWLTFNRFSAYTGALLVLIVVLWVVLTLISQQQNEAYVASYQRANQLNAELQAKQRQLDAALNDSELTEQLNDVQRTLNLRQRLLLQMQQITGRNQSSFSALFSDLAAVDQPDVWLQRILLADDHLTLQGHTLSAQQLPVWLADFGRYDTLQNRPFGVFELRDEGEQGLSFTVGHLNHEREVTNALGGRQP